MFEFVFGFIAGAVVAVAVPAVYSFMKGAFTKVETAATTAVADVKKVL